MHELTIVSVISVLMIGAISIAFIYHLVLFFFNRDKLFLHYLLYLLFTWVFVFMRTGFLSLLFGIDVENYFFDYFNEPIQIIYLTTYFNFILQSIEVSKSKKSFLYKSWIAILIVLLGYSILFIISKFIFQFESYSTAFISIRIFIFCLTFIMLWQCFKLRHITFQLFILLGSSFYFIFGVISFISNLNLSMDMILYPPEWLMIGSFIDILFFSVAMSYRNKKQWEKMNAALLNDANEIIEIQKIVLEKQNTLENERNRIARDMHDDLGSGLTKINYLSHLAINNIDVTENLSKINKASSQLVESMSEIIWAIKEENNTIDDLVSFIKLYALEYLDNNKITSTFTIVVERNEIEINGDCRRSIYLIVKEALHNVVKHAQATNVTIEVKIVDQIEITIEDNGVGYNQNIKKYGTGNGIKNMRKRIEIFKGQIEIKSEKGTKVIFSLPLNQLNQ